MQVSRILSGSTAAVIWATGFRRNEPESGEFLTQGALSPCSTEQLVVVCEWQEHLELQLFMATPFLTTNVFQSTNQLPLPCISVGEGSPWAAGLVTTSQAFGAGCSHK